MVFGQNRFRPKRIPSQRASQVEQNGVNFSFVASLQAFVVMLPHNYCSLQDIYGWCEEATYDKLRKALVGMVKKMAEQGQDINSCLTCCI